MCLKLTDQEKLENQAYYKKIEGNCAQETLRVAVVASGKQKLEEDRVQEELQQLVQAF